MTPLVILVFIFAIQLWTAEKSEQTRHYEGTDYEMESLRLVCYTRLGSARWVGSCAVAYWMGWVKGEFETYIYLRLELNGRHMQRES